MQRRAERWAKVQQDHSARSGASWTDGIRPRSSSHPLVRRWHVFSRIIVDHLLDDHAPFVVIQTSGGAKLTSRERLFARRIDEGREVDWMDCDETGCEAGGTGWAVTVVVVVVVGRYGNEFDNIHQVVLLVGGLKWLFLRRVSASNGTWGGRTLPFCLGDLPTECG